MAIDDSALPSDEPHIIKDEADARRHRDKTRFANGKPKFAYVEVVKVEFMNICEDLEESIERGGPRVVAGDCRRRTNRSADALPPPTSSSKRSNTQARMGDQNNGTTGLGNSGDGDDGGDDGDDKGKRPGRDGEGGSLSSPSKTMKTESNRYWIPNLDINKKVITQEIQYYLGPESTIRPYTREGEDGFLITTPGECLTDEQIDDICRKSKEVWEKQAAARASARTGPLKRPLHQPVVVSRNSRGTKRRHDDYGHFRASRHDVKAHPKSCSLQFPHDRSICSSSSGSSTSTTSPFAKLEHFRTLLGSPSDSSGLFQFRVGSQKSVDQEKDGSDRKDVVETA